VVTADGVVNSRMACRPSRNVAIPIPVAKNAPAVPVAKACPIERAIDAGDGCGDTPNSVMNPSCSEWMPTAIRKATVPAPVTARWLRQAASQMTAPANPVTNTWGSSAAGRTSASWRWYQW